MSDQIYLDNSATTRVRQEVLEAMLPYLSDQAGNPSSLHAMGRQAAEAVAGAREQVARLLNCEADEIYFTPCGTYSNNTAIIGRARFAEANGLGRHMITSRIEHPAVLGPAKYLESLGWRVDYLPVDREGLVSPADLERSIGPDTSLISIMWVNNEIGSVQPLAALAAAAAGAGVYFHTDAVQAAGKLPVDVQRAEVSTLSLSGHKFHAPKGIGVLFARRGAGLMPIVFGGGQERGLFPGTQSVADIVAIGKAAELALAELDENMISLRRMQQILMDKLLAVDGAQITGPRDPQKRLPGHLSLVLPGCRGEALVMRADLKGVCISSGSACHKGIVEPSQVLLACGVADTDALGSVRISAGRLNSVEECRKAADLLLSAFLACSRQASSRAPA